MWFPQLHQTYINKRNPNYLNSVFIGFTVPILNLWSIVLPEFLSLLKGFDFLCCSHSNFSGDRFARFC